MLQFKINETLTYIDNLQKAGIEASVDIYPNCFHAFDMLLPFEKISKQAAQKFEEKYLYACENYFADRNGKNNETARLSLVMIVG